MIDQLISELVAYGLQNGLIDDADKVCVTNGLLELFQKQELSGAESICRAKRVTLHFRGYACICTVRGNLRG